MNIDTWKDLFDRIRWFWIFAWQYLRAVGPLSPSEVAAPTVPGEVRAQAIVDLRRQSGWAFELLFRPDGVPTEDFYRFAHLRPTGLEELLDIDRQVVEAARALQSWGWMVTLNVHELLLARANPALLERWLTLSPALTVFELSERLSPALSETTLSVLRAWREAGFRYVIDDFDLSLRHIRLFFRARPDGIKLDRAIVRRARSEWSVRMALYALEALCRSLGVLIIAEGVETAAEGDALGRGIGAAHQQGFAHHRPAPYLEAARTWTDSWATPPRAFGQTRWETLQAPESRDWLLRMAESVRTWERYGR